MQSAGVVGVTSNPTIFQKALSEGSAYDEQLREVLAETDDPKEIFVRLAGKDVGDACDLLRPVWEKTGGRDGFVSMEVDPRLAYDTEATVAEAVRLHELVDRPNLLVKIPATKPGLPAIEEMIAKGKSINVTLIFSLERYAEVTEAYIRGLERLVAHGGDPSRVHSVASFFVSRVDTEADRRLDEIGGHDELKGRLAVANARLAYQLYLETFAGERWDFLVSKGAATQRCLWASTSTKNPAYSDVLYVERADRPGDRQHDARGDDRGLSGSRDSGADAHAPRPQVGEALRAARRGGRRLRRRHGDPRARGRREVRCLVRRAARGHPRLERGARHGLSRRS